MKIRRILARLAASCGLLLPPEGHVSKRQLLRLFWLARKSSGPFLEVGPWVGRSTSAIAWPLRNRRNPSKFITIEKGFASLEDWENFWGISVYAKPPSATPGTFSGPAVRSLRSAKISLIADWANS